VLTPEPPAEETLHSVIVTPKAPLIAKVGSAPLDKILQLENVKLEAALEFDIDNVVASEEVIWQFVALKDWMPAPLLIIADVPVEEIDIPITEKDPAARVKEPSKTTEEKEEQRACKVTPSTPVIFSVYVPSRTQMISPEEALVKADEIVVWVP
jgi:hypothetical protein